MDISISKIIELISERYREKLQQKSGWGKNEVYLLHQKAVNEVLAEVLENTAVLQGNTVEEMP
jgi:hypothetical protein